MLKSAFHSQLPGPVIGMVLLALWLMVQRRQPVGDLDKTAHTLLSLLGLLFVPAGVGIFASFGLLRAAWLPLLLGLFGSTLMSLLIVAAVMNALQRRKRIGQI